MSDESIEKVSRQDRIIDRILQVLNEEGAFPKGTNLSVLSSRGQRGELIWLMCSPDPIKYLSATAIYHDKSKHNVKDREDKDS